MVAVVGRAKAKRQLWVTGAKIVLTLRKGVLVMLGMTMICMLDM
jgi:hypothetical protein